MKSMKLTVEDRSTLIRELQDIMDEWDSQKFDDNLSRVEGLLEDLKRNTRIRINRRKPNEFYEWTIRIGVDPLWVADGVDLTDADRMKERLMESVFRWAHYHEVSVEVIAAPDPKEIRKEQGYRDVE